MLFRSLIAAGHLIGDDEGHGTLALSDGARPILRGEVRFAVRLAAVDEPRERPKRTGRGTAAAIVAPSDRALFEKLKAVRLDLAARSKVPPYVICHDRTLAELAAQRPASEAALAGITGLGTAKIARYGAQLLAAINGEGNRHPLLDNRLSVTVNRTLALHLEGLEVDAIAERRDIDRSTVLGHFAEAIEAGLVEAAAVVGLEPEEIDEIIAAFERCGTLESGRLGPAHAALDGRYDYGTLKCLLAELA